MPENVKVDLRPLERFAGRLETGLRAGTPPVGDAFKQWAVRYRSFVQERFDRFSKGGGDWPPLAESTKRQRRAGRKGPRTKGGRAGKAGAAAGVFSILRDKLSSLLTALTPVFIGIAGQLEERIPFGVRVGYGGPGRHPEGQATIFDIATFHQEGKGHNPRREIIVDPPRNVTDAMAGDMDRALRRLIRETGAGP